MKPAVACLIAFATCASPIPLNAEPSPPAKADVATLLFDSPMWSKAPAGSALDYAFSRKVSQASFGPSFDDHMILKLGPGDDAESRTADVKMFTGENARPAGPFRSDKQNPTLLIMLEYNVQELSKLFKANPRYLKNAIRKAWRENAKVVDGPIDVDGKSVPGTKITVTPFAGDEEKSKMMGLEEMTYTVEISKDVPGTIAAIDIHAPENGKALFSETLRYHGDKKQ